MDSFFARPITNVNIAPDPRFVWQELRVDVAALATPDRGTGLGESVIARQSGASFTLVHACQPLAHTNEGLLPTPIWSCSARTAGRA
jgi:hypothetical protein